MSFLTVLALGGGGGLCLGAFHLWREGLLVDGTLSLWAVTAVVSIELLLVLAAFLYRRFRARREEEAP